MKLPKELFVRWNSDSTADEPWLQTGESIEDLMDAPPDKQTVGVYRLEKVVKAESTVSLMTDSGGGK